MNPSSEREAFEAWALGRNWRDFSKFATISGASVYSQHDLQKMWDGWQARAALSTPHRAIQDLIKARDTFGWSPEVDEKINALRSLSTQPQQAGWISVRDHLPPDREMVAVAWMDVEDHDHADRYDIDYVEEGVWQFYFSQHEHYLIAGVAKGNSEVAPYTHWQRIGAIPAPLPPVPGQEGEQP